MGQSVVISRICRVKQVSESNRPRIYRVTVCLKKRTYAVSTTNMSFLPKLTARSSQKRSLPFLPCSRSRSFTRCLAKVRHVAPQRNPTPASQKSHWITTLLCTCKLFQKSDRFFANFRGSVCRYFEDLSGKTFQNPIVRDRLSRNRHTL